MSRLLLQINSGDAPRCTCRPWWQHACAGHASIVCHVCGACCRDQLVGPSGAAICTKCIAAERPSAPPRTIVQRRRATPARTIVPGVSCRPMRHATRASCSSSVAAMVQKPVVGFYAYHRFHGIGSRWCMELLDSGGCMGTVPRQESVPNESMCHRELLK